MKYLITSLIITIVVNITYSQYVDTIYVGFDKSSFLIFDDDCTFEQGSQDIIVKTPSKKVIIQAALEDFKETNLLVQCKNDFYLFLIRYKENPKKTFRNYQKAFQKQVKVASNEKDLSILVDHAAKKDQEIKNRNAEKIKSSFDADCKKVELANKTINNRGGVLGRVTFTASKLYIKEDKIFLNMTIDNSSKLSYDLDVMSFIVRDYKNKIKQTSNQDIVIKPIYIYNQTNKINGKESIDIIYVFNKFVLTKDKQLAIETWENNGDLQTEGGRKMSFSLFANDLLKIEEL